MDENTDPSVCVFCSHRTPAMFSAVSSSSLSFHFQHTQLWCNNPSLFSLKSFHTSFWAVWWLPVLSDSNTYDASAAGSETHTHTHLYASSAPPLAQVQDASQQLTAALTYGRFLITKLPSRKLLRNLADKADVDGNKEARCVASRWLFLEVVHVEEVWEFHFDTVTVP